MKNKVCLIILWKLKVYLYWKHVLSSMGLYHISSVLVCSILFIHLFAALAEPKSCQEMSHCALLISWPLGRILEVNICILVCFIRSNVQSDSILNFLLSVLPPVKDRAAFMAVCMLYIVTVRKTRENFFFLEQNPKNGTVLERISLICKTSSNLVFMWWLRYKLFLFETCLW